MKTAYKFDNTRHVHSLNGKPLTGTSSIGGVLHKGGLVWWASKMACQKLGWKHPKHHSKDERIASAQPVLEDLQGKDVSDYLKLLDKAYKAHNEYKNKKAEEGTDLHETLERYVKSEMGKGTEITEEERELIEPFIEWTENKVDEFLWSEAHCYSEDLWVGGISDAGAKLNNGKVVLLDFKSSKDAYPGQFIQCSGYSIEILENGLISKDGKHQKDIEKIDGIGVVPFGGDGKPKIKWNIDDWQEGFRSAVVLYRLLNKNERS